MSGVDEQAVSIAKSVEELLDGLPLETKMITIKMIVGHFSTRLEDPLEFIDELIVAVNMASYMTENPIEPGSTQKDYQVYVDKMHRDLEGVQ